MAQSMSLGGPVICEDLEQSLPPHQSKNLSYGRSAGSLRPLAPWSTPSLRSCPPRSLQSLTVIAVRFNVRREVCARHDIYKFCDAVPLCLCFFKHSTRLDRALSARTQSFPAEALPGLAFLAGMEQLIVGSQAPSAGDV